MLCYPQQYQLIITLLAPAIIAAAAVKLFGMSPLEKPNFWMMRGSVAIFAFAAKHRHLGRYCKRIRD